MARWTQEKILDAVLEWRDRYGRLPCSDDWNPQARWTTEQRARFAEGDWPNSKTVRGYFGDFASAYFMAGLRKAARPVLPSRWLTVSVPPDQARIVLQLEREQDRWTA